jgi:hypothetical protein
VRITRLLSDDDVAGSWRVEFHAGDREPKEKRPSVR